MKFRRHTNNKGTRRVRKGKLKKDAEHWEKKYVYKARAIKLKFGKRKTRENHLFDSATTKKLLEDYFNTTYVYDIEFMGKAFLLIGDIDADGAIATPYQYDNALMSYAHLRPDGLVIRCGQVIGSKEDIKVIRRRK